jgi:Fe-S-cluster containining protein
VTQELPIAIKDGARELRNTAPNRTKIIGLELDILGEQINLNIAVGPGQATLADIVPVARALCEKITTTVTKILSRQDGRIPCHPGCSACCHYLVPLSVPEALRLMEEFTTMAPFLQSLMQRSWLLTASRILSKRPPPSVVGPTTHGSPDHGIDLNAVSDWHRSFKQACPFLRTGLCTIYEIRPLACREYFVKGSHKACADPTATPEKIETPLRTIEILGRLAGELERSSVEAVMLPLVLVWHTNNLQRARRTWPAQLMVERFVEIAKTAAPQNLTTLTRPSQTRIPTIETPPFANRGRARQSLLSSPTTTPSIRQLSE